MEPCKGVSEFSAVVLSLAGIGLFLMGVAAIADRINDWRIDKRKTEKMKAKELNEMVERFKAGQQESLWRTYADND